MSNFVIHDLHDVQELHARSLDKSQGSNRTFIEDISPRALTLDAVIGGATSRSFSVGTFHPVFAAHGTNTPTNTNSNGCHDSDSEWDYSSL